MNFKKWVKSIQTAGYNGARTVDGLSSKITLRVNFLSWAVLIVLDISWPDNVFWYKETVVPLSMGLDFTNLMKFAFDSSWVIFRFMGAHQALWSKVINLAKFPALSCLGINKMLLKSDQNLGENLFHFKRENDTLYHQSL